MVAIRKDGKPWKIRKDRIDMTGKVYGQVTVLGFSHRTEYPSGQPKYFWKVRCSCGYEWEALGHSLRSGDISRCLKCRGEYLRQLSQARLRNRSGEKQRSILLLRLLEHGRGRQYPLSRPIYAAQCDCGAVLELRISSNGRWRADCGCGIGRKVPWITVDGRTQSMIAWAAELGISRQCINGWHRKNFNMEAAIRWRLSGRIGPNPNGRAGRPRGSKKKAATLSELPRHAVSFIEGTLVIQPNKGRSGK